MNVKLFDTLAQVDNLRVCHKGTVVSNTDPKKLGRIKVQISGILMGAVDQLPWTYPLNPGSGNGTSGAFIVPEVGANLVVDFPYHDIYMPVYRGFWQDQKTHQLFFDGTNYYPGSMNAAFQRKLASQTTTTSQHTLQPESGSDPQVGDPLDPNAPLWGGDEAYPSESCPTQDQSSDYPNIYGFIDSTGNLFKVNKKQGGALFVHGPSGTTVAINRQGQVSIKIVRRGDLTLQQSGSMTILTKGNVNWTVDGDFNLTVLGNITVYSLKSIWLWAQEYLGLTGILGTSFSSPASLFIGAAQTIWMKATQFRWNSSEEPTNPDPGPTIPP